MRTQTLLTLAVPALAASVVSGIRIIQSNDDGWAEHSLRSFHDALIAAGHDAVVSAPADNKSGTGSTDINPLPRLLACQYSSCPPTTGTTTGRNETAPRLNWVNSFPRTSMRFGLDSIGPAFWGGADRTAELAVAGPNVGSNLWLAVHVSGTVGAAVHAVRDAGVPAIAFSGASDGTAAWDAAPAPLRSLVYARLAARLTDEVVAAGTPYLPAGVWLNVNFPEVDEAGGVCTDPAEFRFVLSRINPGLLSDPDVEHCGGTRLPTETEVVNNAGGCYVSVSVGDANDKTTAAADMQAVVLEKLGHLFTCLE